MFKSLFIFLLTASLAANAQMSIDRLPIDGYAATVNERVITISDVRRAIQEMELRLRTRYAGEELAQKRYELFLSGLDQVIDQSLVIEEFKTLKYDIPERMVEDEINQIVLRDFEGDRAAMLADLAERQMTMEDWRVIIREGLIVRTMRAREVGERIVVTPQQVLDAYESRKDGYRQPAGIYLRLIFRRGGSDAEETLALMRTLREEIVAGKVFAKAAKEMSQDATASSGGDWGWVEPEQFRNELRDALLKLDAGEVSDVVETPEGLYLLLAEKKRSATVKSFDEVRDEIETDLRRRQIEELSENWINRLRKKYSVIYHIPVPPATP
jgi:parvulin-like peptidyl-prolyl isomerase